MDRRAGTRRDTGASASEAGNPDRNLYRRGAVYWCRYLVNGIERRTSLRTDDVRKARSERDKLLGRAQDVRAGRAPENPVLWQDATGEFLLFLDGQVVAGAIGGKTAIRYTTSLKRLTRALMDEEIEAITTATVMDFVLARREEEKSASTIRNDVTAWSRVMSFAVVKAWIPVNPIRSFERGTYIGRDEDTLNPPTDEEAADLAREVASWSASMSMLVTWLRETGMRLAEALNITRGDIHPDGRTATLRRGVKRGKVRTIDLGRAAALLPLLAARGRLFGDLPDDSAAASTRYGQWKRQRRAREGKAALAGRREAEELRTFRLHDLRHAFAIASLIDEPTSVYRLKEHLGHGSVKTTEGYLRFLSGEGAQRRYTRRPDLFGSLPPAQIPARPAQKPPHPKGPKSPKMK